MKHSIAVSIVLMFITIVFATPTDQIPNLQQPRFNVFTSGQPTPAGFRLIADTGVKTVINVLPERECQQNEESMVIASKMLYWHFPFETTGFTRETFEQFGWLVNSVQKPVLVHCSTGNHAGGLWFGYRVLIDKASLPLALKEARMIGMKPALEDAMIDWLVQERLRAAK